MGVSSDAGLDREVTVEEKAMGAYDRVYFRGVYINKRTRAMIWSAEDSMSTTFDMLQGSWSTSVSASALTHSKAGVYDAWPRGASTVDLTAAKRAVRRLRDVGFAAWLRTPAQGFSSYHIHAVAIGDPGLSCPPGSASYGYGAWAQQDEYLVGGDGLAGSNPDTMPYRPNPPVVFDYAAWVAKQGRIALALRTVSSKMRRLRRRQRRLARQLHNH
jgi:hypothetical protein